MNLKQKIINNIKNIPGKTINKKIVVIECDDWGSIRMPSIEVYQKLLNTGILVNRNRFNKYDTLADKQDLEELFDILISVKDKDGKPAVMTPVTNVANPDFEKIKTSDFSQYFNEPFTNTLEKYNRHPDTFALWQKGIRENIFVPEFHGREHLSVQLWMKKLKEGTREVLTGFDLNFTSVPIKNVSGFVNEFRPEFYYDSNDQIPFLHKSIKDGTKLFHNLFGYIPTSFIPSNAIFHPQFEKTVAETGIKFLYTNHFMSTPVGNGTIKKKYYPANKKTKEGLTYYTRNCVFEPTAENFQGIEYTLKQMEAAFRWKKPAIISTHRVNFVGGIDTKNREAGLKELKNLLNSIVNKWPDVEFMSSKQLFNSMSKE